MSIMQQKKWWKLLFILILLGILYYTFRDSMGDILQQLAATPLYLLVLISLCPVGYLLLEGHIVWLVAHRNTSSFTYGNGTKNAFCCAFYRVATLGSGSGVAGIYYLNKVGIPIANATGMVLFQYTLHKVSMSLYSLIMLLLQFSFIKKTYDSYIHYIFVGFLLTILIAGVLLSVTLIPQVQNWYQFLSRKIIERNPKWEDKLEKIGTQLALLQSEGSAIAKDKVLLLRIVLTNLAKFSCWYIIPFIILHSQTELTLLQTLTVTSLVLSLAGVIPTPAGIGSIEALFLLLYSRLISQSLAASAMLLFRYATMLLPCILGGVIILIEKLKEKNRTA